MRVLRRIMRGTIANIEATASAVPLRARRIGRRLHGCHETAAFPERHRHNRVEPVPVSRVTNWTYLKFVLGSL